MGVAKGPLLDGGHLVRDDVLLRLAGLGVPHEREGSGGVVVVLEEDAVLDKEGGVAALLPRHDVGSGHAVMEVLAARGEEGAREGHRAIHGNRGPEDRAVQVLHALLEGDAGNLGAVVEHALPHRLEAAGHRDGL